MIKTKLRFVPSYDGKVVVATGLIHEVWKVECELFAKEKLAMMNLSGIMVEKQTSRSCESRPE